MDDYDTTAPPCEVRAWMARMGQKGGKAKGDCKRRPKEHYTNMARLRWANQEQERERERA
jgi:hypothetical protein